MHSKIELLLNAIDSVNEWVGRITAFLIPTIMLIAVYEVVMRYFFNAPTVWAWDINTQLFAFVVFLGAGYTLLKKGHVSVDVFYSRWSERVRAILDIITFPIFIIFIAVLGWTLGDFAVNATMEREVMSTAFAPPVYPMRIAMAFGVVLILLQGIGDLIRNLKTVLSAKK